MTKILCRTPKLAFYKIPTAIFLLQSMVRCNAHRRYRTYQYKLRHKWPSPDASGSSCCGQ